MLCKLFYEINRKVKVKKDLEMDVLLDVIILAHYLMEPSLIALLNERNRLSLFSEKVKSFNHGILA